MKSKTQFIVIVLALAVISLVAVQSALAQHSHEHDGVTKWQTGMVRLTNTAWAGNVRFRSGMYHVKHVVEGDKHWLVFNEVTLGAGYREGLMWEGKEVARLECRIAPAEKSVRNTKVILATNPSGTRSIQEIQISGESVRHILIINEPAVSRRSSRAGLKSQEVS